MKKNFQFILALLFLTTFLGINSAYSQASVHTNNGGTKTVVYKIKKQAEQNPLTPKMASDIDKQLSSKNGIISAATNSTRRTVSVQMNKDLPEEEVKKILISVFKLEVESYETTDNTK